MQESDKASYKKMYETLKEIACGEKVYSAYGLARKADEALLFVFHQQKIDSKHVEIITGKPK